MYRIRDLREDRDLRQKDVALAIGIDQQTLSNYETGRTRPDSEALIRLADFFDVSIDYLVGRTPSAQPCSNAGLVREIERIQGELETLKRSLQTKK
ncbi:MAG: helix-turn-helix domain-containing protein [Gemmiger sp.]